MPTLRTGRSGCRSKGRSRQFPDSSSQFWELETGDWELCLVPPRDLGGYHWNWLAGREGLRERLLKDGQVLESVSGRGAVGR